MTDKKEEKEQIGLKDAVSIGIGGMVGGGIFAVLGLSVELAKGGVPISFLVAGCIALMTAYSYAKLSVAYPDEGGTVRFIYEGFGYSVLSGGLNNMLWVSYIIMLSLYSSAFGAYASGMFDITGDHIVDKHIFISAIILFSTFINYYSIKVVGEVESFAVIIKLIILLAFVAAGFWGITENPNFIQLSPENWESPVQLIAGGMVIFVAYEGFELIANSAPDIKHPMKNTPKAYYYSVIFVILLYIAIAVVTVGSLDFADIGKAQDYALAEAAKPKFGQIGFTIISIAAMISTFSAINATLLGGSRTNYEVALYHELPEEFTKQLWGKPLGLLIISIFTLVIANTIDLESISTSGSAGFLVIFGIVNFIAFKKRKTIFANKSITIIGFICCILAFIILTIQQIQENATGIIIAFSIFGTCFLGEWLYKKHLKKKIDHQ
ncbi:APC family permease [Flammeovirga agarivorans]|uniref:APC family permease n=1 Tax=Flammeovirga agarivorans TaxID=2726742 RepID=A0A7X8SHU4_9BACT|nr:APC family permease [Flammeovirga agarivorans]NLR90417.1 APC family permease [Flammeovirga agarivorans]